jgi:hypothetical protein
MISQQFSFFKGSITQTKPTQSIDIESVYKVLVSERKEAYLISESGLICLDFDKRTDLRKVKLDLGKDKFCHLLFISPGGIPLK